MSHLEPVDSRKIAGFTSVCNEDDILEQFIRHNIRFVDTLHVLLDWKSVDNSRLIIQALISEGLPIQIHEASPVFKEDVRSVFVRDQLYWSYVFLDDDEFIFGIEPENFKACIRSIEEPLQIWLPWRTYLPNPNWEPLSHNPISLNIARSSEANQFYKCIYVRAGRQTPHLVGPGAHNMLDCPEMRSITGALLAHLPVRSFRQLILKSFSAQINLNHLIMYTTAKNYAEHWRSDFKMLVTERSFSFERLNEYAYFYGQTAHSSERLSISEFPLPLTQTRVYSPSTTPESVLMMRIFSIFSNISQ